MASAALASLRCRASVCSSWPSAVSESLPVTAPMTSLALPLIESIRPFRACPALLCSIWSPRWRAYAHCVPRRDRMKTPSGSLIGLDGHLDGFAAGDDVEDVEHVVQRNMPGDQVFHRNLSGRDVLQGPLVVLRRRAVGAVDVQLAVVHDVGVTRDGRVGLRQPAEEGDPPVAGGHRNRLLLGDVGRGGRDDHVGAAATGQFHDLAPRHRPRRR